MRHVPCSKCHVEGSYDDYTVYDPHLKAYVLHKSSHYYRCSKKNEVPARYLCGSCLRKVSG